MKVIEKLLKKQVIDIISTFKSKFCCECTQGIECQKQEGNKEIFLNLPCNCIVCSEWCLNNYLKKVISDPSNFCICGIPFSIKNFFEIYRFSSQNNLEDQRKFISIFINHKFKTTCCFCLDRFDLYSDEVIHRIVFEDKTFTEILQDKKFIHLICNQCYEKQKVKEKQVFSCIFCESDHKITNLKKKINISTTEKEDDCIIY